MTDVESGRSPLGFEVVGILLIILATVNSTYSVVTDVVGQRLGISVVCSQFQPGGEALPEYSLQRTVVARGVRAGNFHHACLPYHIGERSRRGWRGQLIAKLRIHKVMPEDPDIPDAHRRCTSELVFRR